MSSFSLAAKSSVSSGDVSCVSSAFTKDFSMCQFGGVSYADNNVSSDDCSEVSATVVVDCLCSILLVYSLLSFLPFLFQVSSFLYKWLVMRSIL